MARGKVMWDNVRYGNTERSEKGMWDKGMKSIIM